MFTKPLCNSSRQEITCSVQAERWARTRSCSSNSNLAPNSDASEPPPSINRVNLREDPKQSPPLVPDTVFLRLRIVTGLKKVVTGRTAFADKRCFALKLSSTFRFGVWLEARKGIARLSPLFPSAKIGPSKTIFQPTRCSPDLP